MNGKTYLLTAIGLALAHYGAPALASDATSPRDHRVQEVSDQELGSMRGRYTVGNNTVAWFGVSMISTWQNSAGQVLQSTLALSMNFSGKQPQITFVPSVNITAANAPMPAPSTPTTPTTPTTTPVTPAASTLASSGPSRSASGLGLANVGGMVQSVQVAGDGNTASNQASLTTSYGNAPASSTANSNVSSNTQATTTNANASATASYNNGAAQVLLNIAGEGSVRQWIQNGNLGQSVQLTADNQVVSNLLNIDLIRQALTTNTQLMQSLTQNVAQATNLTRGISNR